MAKVNDLSRSLAALEQDSTLLAVVEMGAAKWLVCGTVPGVARQPLKKLDADAPALLRLIERWRGKAERCGRRIARVVVAYEAGRDGFWLARWLMARGIEVHVIHSASVAVSRERKRAKTDRLDAIMLMRVLLGWLRGERGHCSMVAIPSVAEEDARRPSREREILIGERARISNRIKGALKRARGRDGRMLAARVEPKNGSRSQEIKSPLTTKAPYKRGWEKDRWPWAPSYRARPRLYPASKVRSLNKKGNRASH